MAKNVSKSKIEQCGGSDHTDKFSASACNLAYSSFSFDPSDMI